MNRYEYCAIRDNLDGEKKIKLKFFDAGGNHKATEITDVHRNIAQLGMNGWEMIKFSQFTEPNARIYYFKKAI